MLTFNRLLGAGGRFSINRDFIRYDAEWPGCD